MSSDTWGVDRGYMDASGHWQVTPARTRQAVLAAMGVEDAGSVPVCDESVRIAYSGSPTQWTDVGELTLEDGTTLQIDGHLPRDLPWGYHEFRRRDGEQRTRLIVTPGQCVLPSRRQWGWTAQLYAVRSKSSWGMGDLGDLRRLAHWSASQHAGLLLVNPLCAVSPGLPQQPSPYYPSSRRFLNPLYLRVEEVPGAAQLQRELEPLAGAGRALNARERIDRDAVYGLKEQALKAIWAHWSGDLAFDRYCRERGKDLEHFAVYCALAAQWGSDWRRWPGEYCNPASPGVAVFTRERSREVAYHKWLQWLTEGQLAEAAKQLPLVQDVPIGVDPGGADAWVWQDLLAKDCMIGAPPDLFNTAGQNWLLPPFVPHKLRAAGYEPFVQTVRSGLRHAAGLRLDHVMGLWRLYWIPNGFSPAHGAYVRYRAEELLAVMALESSRAGAFVVGEDLGTVEPEMRAQLAEHRILSFRVLWFEEHPPAMYPPLAMAAVTTHDLPTIAGLWTGADMAAQEELGFPPNESVQRVRQQVAELIQMDDGAPIDRVIETTYRRLSEASSSVLLATLEDAMAVADRPNMPGTISEWPNWSIALPGGLEALETASLPRRIAQALERTPALVEGDADRVRGADGLR